MTRALSSTLFLKTSAGTPLDSSINSGGYSKMEKTCQNIKEINTTDCETPYVVQLLNYHL